MKVKISLLVILQLIFSALFFYASFVAFKGALAAFGTNGQYVPVLTNFGPYFIKVVAVAMLVIALYIMYKFGTKGFFGGIIYIIAALIGVFLHPKYAFIGGILAIIASVLVFKNVLKRDPTPKEEDKVEPKENVKEETKVDKKINEDKDSYNTQPVEQEIVEQPENYQSLDD